MKLREVREWHDEQANECRHEDEAGAKQFHETAAWALLEAERKGMSDLAAIETHAELAAWLSDNMPGASLHELDGEVIIHTGLEVTMGDYLNPIEGDE